MKNLPSKSNNKSGIVSEEELPVMEYFYTIQGEGANTGMAAFFIRLAGCDVGCHWCDVKESWDPQKPLIAVKQLAETAVKYGAENAVITGGEPLMCKLDALTAELKKNGIKTFLETSGAYPLSGKWDWITLSPKKRKLPLTELYSMANELKVIVHNLDDLGFAEECASNLGKSKMKKVILFLQPEWSRREKVIPAIIDFVKKNPKWRISLQTHKYIGIP